MKNRIVMLIVLGLLTGNVLQAHRRNHRGWGWRPYYYVAPVAVWGGVSTAAAIEANAGANREAAEAAQARADAEYWRRKSNDQQVAETAQRSKAGPHRIARLKKQLEAFSKQERQLDEKLEALRKKRPIESEPTKEELRLEKALERVGNRIDEIERELEAAK